MHLLNGNNVHVDADPTTEQALNPKKNKIFDELSILKNILHAEKNRLTETAQL